MDLEAAWQSFFSPDFILVENVTSAIRIVASDTVGNECPSDNSGVPEKVVVTGLSTKNDSVVQDTDFNDGDTNAMYEQELDET